MMQRFGMSIPCVLASLVGLVLATRVAAEDAQGSAEAKFFDHRVAPILASYCLECHSGAKPKGGLDLSSRRTAMKGGENGLAIQAGKPAKSLLWDRVRSGEMPPKEELPKTAKQTLRKWIAAGAHWGTDPIDPFRFTTTKRAGLDWWSLQPIKRVDVPAVKAKGRVRNAIDAFVLAKLEEQGLTLSSDADPRVLIRRLYFDLTGLPPSPEEVQRFVRRPTEKAYRELADRLLDSPHYGERWGRHWLDVARFGESDGFERNGPRKNFWPFRDWVIDALNEDMPYDQFARMQIAGDLLTGDSPQGLAAAGFLVAGIHNTVVGSSEMMRRQARQDELEEIIAAVGQTFIGLTVHCARCHDHKFDPIRQREYYRLIASIAGVHHGEKETASAEAQLRLVPLGKQIKQLSDRIEAIGAKARTKVLAQRKAGKAKPSKPPQPYARWEFDKDLKDSVGEMHGKAIGGARLVNGALVVDGKSYVQTVPLSIDLAEKTLEAWVLLDNLDQRGGAAISVQTTNGVVFDAIVFGEREPRRWMAGSNNFRRTKSFSASEEKEAAGKPVHIAIVYQKDGAILCYRNGRLYGKPYKSAGLQTYKAGSANVAFGLRHAPPGGNKMLKGRILRAQLHSRALSPQAVAASAGVGSDYVSAEEIDQRLTEVEMSQRRELIERRKQLLEQERTLLAKSKMKIYTVKAGNPGLTQLLPRGDVMASGPVVLPGAVAAVKGVKAEFGLKSDAPDSDRRRKLAEWISGRGNPLFARVIVNRLWHYHFGRGIVETPSDFGFNGGRPSHPKLLDWLAGRLIANDYRLKPIHRLIVSSSAYRQSSRFNKAASQMDAGNRLLWRKSPQRMEAEALRDSILLISGKLNLRRGGPGYVDVAITPNNGTTYYTPIDRDGPEFNRRTVYRFWPRGGRSALLDTFDCPDPSTAAPRRTVTTTPLQSLSLLNNAFVLRMADGFARRVEKDAGVDRVKQVERAYQLVYNRSPDDEERQLASRLVAEHGLPALARALFNSNEFIVIE